MIKRTSIAWLIALALIGIAIGWVLVTTTLLSMAQRLRADWRPGALG